MILIIYVYFRPKVQSVHINTMYSASPSTLVTQSQHHIVRVNSA